MQDLVHLDRPVDNHSAVFNQFNLECSDSNHSTGLV